MAPQYSLKGREHHITCPTFVCSAEDDDLSIDAPMSGAGTAGMYG